jgi:hypothetical protein
MFADIRLNVSASQVERILMPDGRKWLFTAWVDDELSIDLDEVDDMDDLSKIHKLYFEDLYAYISSVSTPISTISVALFFRLRAKIV